MKTIRVRNGVVRLRGESVRSGGALRIATSFAKPSDSNIDALRSALSGLRINTGKKFISM